LDVCTAVDVGIDRIYAFGDRTLRLQQFKTHLLHPIIQTSQWQQNYLKSANSMEGYIKTSEDL
jgi:hypothetical protein